MAKILAYSTMTLSKAIHTLMRETISRGSSVILTAKTCRRRGILLQGL